MIFKYNKHKKVVLTKHRVYIGKQKKKSRANNAPSDVHAEIDHFLVSILLRDSEPLFRP